MTNNHLLLYRLAELMLKHEQHVLPVDLLFDDEQIGDFVKSIQIDSPYQQMLLEGVLTETVKDEKLYVSFTVEGYFHYVLGEVIYNQNEGQGTEVLKQIVEESKLNGAKEGVEQCLIRDVQKDDLTRLMWIIDNWFKKSEILIAPFICALKYLGVNETLNKLLEFQTENDWELLLKLKFKLNDLQLFNLVEELVEKCQPYNNGNSKASIIFRLESNDLYPPDVEILLESLTRISHDFETNYNLQILIGKEYKKWGQYDQALEYYQKSLDIYLNNSKKEEEVLAFLYKKIGQIFCLKSEFPLALDNFDKSLQYYLKHNKSDNYGVADLYNNIGLLYQSQKEFDKALIYFEKTLSLFFAITGKTSPTVQDIYSNIGNCWEEKGDFEKAINFYEKATLISSKILHNRFVFIDFSLSSISECYIKLGEKEERMGNFIKSIEFYQKGINHIENISDRKYDLRDLLFKIAEFLKNQQEYQLSIDYFMQCLSIDDEDLDSCFCIAQCYEKIDQMPSAFYYYLKTITVFESVCFDDIENWINGINVYDEKTKINPFIKAKELAYALNRIHELPEWMNESNI